MLILPSVKGSISAMMVLLIHSAVPGLQSLTLLLDFVTLPTTISVSKFIYYRLLILSWGIHPPLVPVLPSFRANVIICCILELIYKMQTI